MAGAGDAPSWVAVGWQLATSPGSRISRCPPPPAFSAIATAIAVSCAVVTGVGADGVPFLLGRLVNARPPALAVGDDAIVAALAVGLEVEVEDRPVAPAPPPISQSPPLIGLRHWTLICTCTLRSRLDKKERLFGGS